MNEILVPALTIGALGLVFGTLLSVAGKIFTVKKDERIALIEEVLPGANCGGCGYTGCSAYAEAVASGEAECDLCSVGGASAASSIGDIMGKKSEFSKKYAFIGCTGGANERYMYDGAPDCAYAAMLMGGVKTCSYGCIGLGNCANACPYGAISMADGLPLVDEEKCTGCGACKRACPRGLIDIVPEKAKYKVCCNSNEKALYMKASCPDGCIGCGKCTKVCAFGAIMVENNLAKIDYDKCTGCGKCAEACPKHIIR